MRMKAKVFLFACGVVLQIIAIGVAYPQRVPFVMRLLAPDYREACESVRLLESRKSIDSRSTGFLHVANLFLECAREKKLPEVPGGVTVEKISLTPTVLSLRIIDSRMREHVPLKVRLSTGREADWDLAVLRTKVEALKEGDFLLVTVILMVIGVGLEAMSVFWPAGTTMAHTATGSNSPGKGNTAVSPDEGDDHDTMALSSPLPQFQAKVHDFREWYLQAEFLRGAAFQLWDVGSDMMTSLGSGSRGLRMGATPPDPAFVAAAHASAFLLYGFAMENLIKAVIVKKDPRQPRVKKGRIHWGFNGHDLIRLVAKAGIKPAPAEEELLNVLSKWAVWQGRYPVPMRPALDSNMRTFPGRDWIEKCYHQFGAALNA